MSEKYWLDKMKENPRYREIWEKIKEQPFNETTEMILDLEAKLAERESLLKTYIQLNEDLTKRLDDRCDICIERHKQSQNQTAIAELEKLKNYLPNIALDIPDMVSYRYLKKQIDQQINKLKGENENV